LVATLIAIFKLTPYHEQKLKMVAKHLKIKISNTIKSCAVKHFRKQNPDQLKTWFFEHLWKWVYDW